MSGLRSLRVLRVGDRVRFDGATHTVVALTGTTVRLASESGVASVVLLTHLLAAVDFELLDVGPALALPPFGLLDGLPEPVIERARAWERHLVEVETGLPPDAPEGARPKAEYDPQRRTLAEREQAKVTELSATGQATSVRTVRRMRHRYHTQGLWGLVDQRATRQARPFGNADPRMVDAIAAQLELETDQSTGTRDRLRRRVEDALAAEHGPGVVALPSKATFNRLVAVLDAGRHSFGSARTRRSLANRPERPFSVTVAARPGEQVPIDSTPLDIMAVYDDGVVGRVELTMAVDVATRTICAGLLRPVDTKAVDAALLLARMLVPEPMRPGWPEALSMAHSAIPYQRLLGLDARLEHAAARPVIVPDTVVVDRDRVFMSEAFLTACRTLGISVQPARPRTPTDKSIVERTFESINTLFCQHVRGYTGANVTMRGADVEAQAVWSVPQLQDLFDEWVLAGWQHRPHEGLRHPHLSGAALSPNEAYAALVARAGHVPVTLTGDDYLELLPACWRQVTDSGIQLDYRTYDCAALNSYRHLPSGVDARRGLWEVHYDPYDLGHVWVRDHHAGGWITVPWIHLGMVRQPFADFTWRRARELVAMRGADDRDELAVAMALVDLLRRAEAGPTTPTSARDQRRDRQVAARTRVAASTTQRPRLAPVPDSDQKEDEVESRATASDEPLDIEVVPFGVFDPLAESEHL